MYCISEGLGLPIASFGVGSPTDKIHAPNENVQVANFLKGVLHVAELLVQFGKG